MPATPTTTTHARFIRNRAPLWALATRSPMSTNPPMAVRMPRVTWMIFFTSSRSVLVDEALERVSVGTQGLRHLGQVGQIAPSRSHSDLDDMVDRVTQELIELL